MLEKLDKLIKQGGDSSEILSCQPVYGGRAYQVVTRKRVYFIKQLPKRAEVPAPLLVKQIQQEPPAEPIGPAKLEAMGLEEIRKSGGLPVPMVYATHDPEPPEASMIVMDWVEGRPVNETDEWLGQGLARMHRYSRPAFGWDVDNVIGNLLQPNRWQENWVEFYREQRLAVQVAYAEQRARLPRRRQQKLMTLLDRLDQYLPDDVTPSLLHGDLWGGNWMVGPGGKPYLIDPAVFYGDRLMDLAFTEYFGGYSRRFYAAYHEAWPIPAYYEDVKPLYQLYYVLVHLVLFGESYGPATDSILSRYV